MDIQSVLGIAGVAFAILIAAQMGGYIGKMVKKRRAMKRDDA